MRVVLPTARSGLITAVILGVARAVGETAPLIMTSFGATTMNVNPFDGAQSQLAAVGLPTRQQSIRQPAGTCLRLSAFILILTVLALFTLARLLGRKRKPRTAPRKFAILRRRK